MQSKKVIKIQPEGLSSPCDIEDLPIFIKLSLKRLEINESLLPFNFLFRTINYLQFRVLHFPHLVPNILHSTSTSYRMGEQTKTKCFPNKTSCNVSLQKR